MARFNGTSGDDTFFPGTIDDDVFQLQDGGTDSAYGFYGNDVFRMGANFDNTDAIDGAEGFDTLLLHGNYSLTIDADSLNRIERIKLVAGFDYDLTTNDANVAAGEKLEIDGRSLGAVTGLTFDGSAETDGRFVIRGGTGDDTLTGGAQGDKFFLRMGGDDAANGGGGNDRFILGTQLGAGDAIDGGGGYDILTVDGAHGDDTLFFSATTLINVEEILFTADTIFTDMATHDATVAAGETLIVDATQLSFLYFVGSAETNGHFSFITGSASSNVTGGALSDTFNVSAHSFSSNLAGLGGADDLTFNTGSDNGIYNAASNSTSTGYDTIHAFDADNDGFQFAGGCSGYDGEVFGAVSTASFDANIAAAADATLGIGHAILVTATSGTLNGHSFAVIDGNDDGVYTAGNDYVIDITGYTGTLDFVDFV